MTAFENRLSTFQTQFEPLLAAQFPESAHNRAAQAARYSVVAGGKRLRPYLVRAAARACGVTDDSWVWPALAVEMIHTYSLIHDDLPAMDDDDLRRGQATCHRVYSEALAILAGDGLQMQAIETLLSAPDDVLSAKQKLAMTQCLSSASGFHGMVGGQALDIDAEGKTISLDALHKMHELKTGALMTAAIEMGCLCQPDITDAHLEKARSFGKHIGLAFQVVDDILDISGDTATLGKAQGADAQHGKATYPALLGLDGAKQYANVLYELAIQRLDDWHSDAEELRALASFVLLRNR